MAKLREYGCQCEIYLGSSLPSPLDMINLLFQFSEPTVLVKRKTGVLGRHLTSLAEVLLYSIFLNYSLLQAPDFWERGIDLSFWIWWEALGSQTM
jgi:hypothetical protein